MTPEEEERRVNVITQRLTGERRYSVTYIHGPGPVIYRVVDMVLNRQVVWEGESHAVARAVASNMNGDDLNDAG